MTGGELALGALIAASGLHTGFQVTVTAVVYPALARTNPGEWAPTHDAHARSIVGVVGVVYALLLAANVWALLTNPNNVWVWSSAAGAALAMGTTALVAGPTHGRLDANPEPDLIRRLLAADRVRTLGALGSFVAALLAGWMLA